MLIKKSQFDQIESEFNIKLIRKIQDLVAQLLKDTNVESGNLHDNTWVNYCIIKAGGFRIRESKDLVKWVLISLFTNKDFIEGPFYYEERKLLLANIYNIEIILDNLLYDTNPQII